MIIIIILYKQHITVYIYSVTSITMAILYYITRFARVVNWHNYIFKELYINRVTTHIIQRTERVMGDDPTIANPPWPRLISWYVWALVLCVTGNRYSAGFNPATTWGLVINCHCLSTHNWTTTIYILIAIHIISPL